MSDADEFRGKTVVVAGGTRGIGRAVSLAFLRRGAQVIATFARDEEAAGNLRQEAGRDRTRLTTLKCDVADEADVAAFWASHGSSEIGVLVCCAGIRRDGLMGMMPTEQWQTVLDVNLTGAFRMARGAIPAMLRQRIGRIVFMTSPSGSHGMKGQANYAASKAGLVGMSKCLAREVGRKGITVNCVCPGFIETDMTSGLPASRIEEMRALVASGRLGTPEEVAAAVMFLASASASYVNGAVLEVAGGL